MAQKNKIIKFVILVLTTVYLGVNPTSVKAEAAATPAWPDFGGHLFGNMLQEIRQNIHGAILGALKTTAVEMIEKNVSNLISGGAGGKEGSLFIQDWDDELFYKPAEKAGAMMESFFKSKFKSRTSDYVAINQAVGSVKKNYYAYVEEIVKGGLTTTSTSKKESSFNTKKDKSAKAYDYCKDPSNLFGQENLLCWMTNAGTLMGNYLEAQGKEIELVAQEQKKAEVQAIAYQGYKAKKTGDMVLTPGSTLKDIQQNALDLGNKILANANNIPEVITSLVVKLSTQAIKQGIGNAQRNIQREMINQSRRITSDIDSLLRQSGAGAIYKPKY